MIYHSESFDTSDRKKRNAIISSRHAEVIVKGSVTIDNCLRQICCRSQAEYDTLMLKLRELDKSIYEKYKNIITYKEVDLFFKNGYYIEKVSLRYDSFNISFNAPLENRDLKVTFIINTDNREYKSIKIFNFKKRNNFQFSFISDMQDDTKNGYYLSVIFNDESEMYYGKYDGISFLIE